MDLSKSNVISFIPSTDLEVSAEFYSEKLGLKLMRSDEYALEYELKEIILRIAKASEVAKTSYSGK